MAKPEKIGVCLHPEDTNYSIEKAKRCFEKIRELGASAVRTDIPWKDIYPEPKTVNQERFEFFENYWQTATKFFGLEGCAVMSRRPGWTRRLKEEDLQTEWKKYTEKVVEMIPERAITVQITNEGNNPFYTMGKNNLKLIKEAIKTIKEKKPKIKTMANLLTGIPGSKDYLEKLVRSGVDEIGIDYYETYGRGNWEEIYKIDKHIKNFEIIMAETGESSFHPNKNKQSNFWGSLWSKFGEIGIKTIYIYELLDNNEKKWRWTPEGHFGLLREDFTPKPAWLKVKELINA